MPYTHFRYIAYEVPTFGYDGTRPQGSRFLPALGPGNDPGETPNAKVPTDIGLTQDALIRLRRLAAVVRTANFQVTSLGDNANTLKVFMAPEFYLRPDSGPSNSYDYGQQRLIQQALRAMFCSTNEFRHWLILPGTSISSLEVEKGWFSSTYRYLNTAYYVTGGQANPQMFAIEKQQPSGIDGVPITGGITGAGSDFYNFFQDWNWRKLRLFEVNGSTMGLDICLDHAEPGAWQLPGIGPGWQVVDRLRVTKKVINEWPAHAVGGAAANPVSLHLLTAGGMPIQTMSVAARANGYILRNDGHPGMVTHTEMQQVTGYQCPAGGGATTPANLTIGNPVAGPPVGFPDAAVAVLNNVAPVRTTALTGNLTVPISAGWAGGMGQNIVIYPSRGMP